MAQLKHGDVKGKILTVNGLIEPHDLEKPYVMNTYSLTLELYIRTRH